MCIRESIEELWHQREELGYAVFGVGKKISRHY
jgi:hypothetical protein